ncbi:hypothetical protein [Kineococcus indalonis]|uniref:hypothetical protein n=1 Tax=Kineococcus indalonis TaxID=2696566 RepID=UPI00196BB2A5|nr:hypothetical protein [Kineococcus indalonis]
MVQTDDARGGRWTSLRTPEREWLWRNPAVPASARATVRPGDAFVDAGGVEECFPTLRGEPDHGDVWSRPWTTEGPGCASVRTGSLSLRRSLVVEDGAVVATYDVSGPPGARVLHAVHALLDLSPTARLLVPGAPAVTVLDQPAPGGSTRTTLPDGAGVPLDVLGPDDGTARCAVVATDRVDVLDGAHRLSLRWRVMRGAGPVSLVVWRNLHGWPEAAPYRSVGVEPLLGAAADLAVAGAGQSGVLDIDGGLTWRLTLTAHREG